MSSAFTPAARPTTLDLKADVSFAARHRLALADLAEGLRLFRLALTLGWLDIRLRYRGSILGPFWLTISTGVMVGALGFLYSTLFHTDIHDYLPYLALSQVLWSFLAAMVSDSCNSFIDAESVIRSVRMPFTVFGLRTIVRNACVLAHNVVVIVVVYIVFGIRPGWDALLCVPGFALWVLDAFALTLLLGAFCARFRDINPIANSVMQIAFFMTPVIWKPEQLGEAATQWLLFDPFFSLLEVVRAPLLGHTSGLTEIWCVALAYSLFLCTVAWVFFVRVRSRVPFWV